MGLWSNNKTILSFLVILFLSIVLIWLQVSNFGFASIFHAYKQKELKIIFFDVGQGSSVFIEVANGNQVLIDGGPGSQILNKLGEAMMFFDRDIDVVILTHPDSDHLSGLVDVLEKYEIHQIIDSCINDPSAAYQEWLKLIAEKKIHRLCAKVGQKIKLDKETEINILYPFSNLEGMTFKNTNDASIVAKLNFGPPSHKASEGQGSILFTGDAEEKTEYQLINFGVDIKAQILQVGHHGSKSSTSEEFLKAVNPETAVIQAGKNNRYGHPHQEILDRLKNIGAKIFRTDLDGDVEFLCDKTLCKKK